MKRLVILTLLVLAGCSSAARKPVQTQRQRLSDRELVLENIRTVMNDPAAYRMIEIKVKALAREAAKK